MDKDTFDALLQLMEYTAPDEASDFTECTGFGGGQESHIYRSIFKVWEYMNLQEKENIAFFKYRIDALTEEISSNLKK